VSHYELFTKIPSQPLVLIFSCMQLKTDQVLVEDPVHKMKAVPNHPQKANSWSCGSQQRHPCQLGCDCLSNSYRLWRGVVTAHTLVRVQHKV